MLKGIENHYSNALIRVYRKMNVKMSDANAQFRN